MLKNKKLLIITAGPVSKIEPFIEPAKGLKIDLVTASFSDLEFESGKNYELRVLGHDLDEFGIIYIRLVGKRLEDATLLARFAKKMGIRVVDRHYGEAHMMPVSLSKAVELSRLIEEGVPIPKTYFGSLKNIREKASNMVGFPFVLKSTSGKKAREVWAPKTHAELDDLIKDLLKEEKAGKRFFAQEFTKASQRVRVFVLGDRAVAAITRPTRWRRRFLKKVGGEFPEGEKDSLNPIPEKYGELAVRAARAVGLDIAGVDIAEGEDGKIVVWEVNSAPAWKLVAKDTGINIEEEILKFLVK
jgi:RimK family alpha-L-glutamate ligase